MSVSALTTAPNGTAKGFWKRSVTVVEVGITTISFGSAR